MILQKRFNLIDKRVIIRIALILFVSFSLFQCKKEEEAIQPNVLFLIVDDMADWAGYLGHAQVKTPNMDKLAKRGIVFTNAHCTSPICGPSRAAVMTGLRPETSGIYTNAGDFRDYVPDVVSMPEYFKNNGYYVMGAGKIIHPYNNVVPDAFHEFGPGVGIVGTPFTDEELATSAMNPTNRISLGPGRRDAVLPLNELSTIDRPSNRWSTFDWGPIDAKDEDWPDINIAEYAVERLKKEYDTPFFLAAGLYKPHQPLFAPDKYFDLYKDTKVALPKTIPDDLDDIPEIGKFFAHLPWSAGTHETVLKHNQWDKGVLGYMATISFADAQLGKIIDALDNSKYASNTWIILWSDHGWHLGEKEHWGKHTPWEESTRVPFIIVPPESSSKTYLKSIDLPVNLVDMYPTLIDLCNLPNKIDLDGVNLNPLILGDCPNCDSTTISTIGRGTHSINSKQWTYIHYFDGSHELYDKITDPHAFKNLANEIKYSDLISNFKSQLISDPNHTQYIRKGPWKAVIQKDEPPLLFNLLEPNGISEQTNLANSNSEIIEDILSYIQDNKLKNKYINISIN